MKVPGDEDRLLPPTLDGRTLLRLGRHHCDDATQEAWVAYLTGRDPDAAAWAYVKRAKRRGIRQQCFSQLEPEQWHRILQRAMP